ncbi:MAG: hypothetical protein IJF17_09355 [Thermoguttaceae bacterium]|nr:hypothetical protein [Thermoguttaceae bacterium]
MKSFIFRKVSILVFIWFLVSFFPLLVFGAEKSIFEGVPQFVVLPESTSEKEVELLPLLTGDKAIEIELLGGQTAVPVKGSSKKKKNAGGEEELSGFTLEQDEAKDENTSVWKIKFNQKGRKATCVMLTHDKKTLTFKWRTKVPAKILQPIGNCVLKITCGEDTHYLALREPMTLETAVMNPKTGSATAKTSKPEIPFPDPSVMFFEIVNLGKFAPGNAMVEFPPATNVSEISPKEPLQIKFNFKDSNGNVNELFHFNLALGFKTNFSVSLLPDNNMGQFSAMMQQAMDPQSDIVITKLRKEINNIKQKLDKQEGWKRNAADTTKISQSQQFIACIEKLRELGKADLKARLYADYGDVKVDLVVMEPISEEQKIAAKQNKKKKGKKETKRESEEQEDSVGGFKF